MNILKLKQKHIIFLFCPLLLISIAVGAEDLNEQPVNVGGRIFCVKPAQTYCVQVLNYPRNDIEYKLKGSTPEYNVDLAV